MPVDYQAFLPMARERPVNPKLLGQVSLLGSSIKYDMPNHIGVYYRTKGQYSVASVPELDAVFDKVLATTDPAEKKTLTMQSIKMSMDTYTGPAIAYVSTPFALGKKVAKWDPIPGWSYPGLGFETITLK